MLLRAVAAFAFFATAAIAAESSADLPKDWVDPDTGHRIIRLSEEAGSTSLYFNFNAYTPDGKAVVIQTPTGIASIDLASRKLTKIVNAKVRLLFVGRKTGLVYYANANSTSSAPKSIFAVPVKGGAPKHIADIPAGTIQTINSDETLMAGVEEFASPDPSKGIIGRDGLIRKAEEVDPKKGAVEPPSKGAMMKARLEAAIPMRIFTLNLKTGEMKTVTQSTDWLNHLEFSPTDPNLLMYCHEGEWQRVDRLWLIRTDVANAKPLKLHARTMKMEIAGHEWFSADGKWVWYDLQTPRGEDFWVAGYEIATGKRHWYHLLRNEWSIHYNTAPDGKLFSGDGGDNLGVAHAPDGKWLYLFRPEELADKNTADHADAQGPLIDTGAFKSEKLVNLKNHEYRLEPNGNFTPDGKWLIFRSNFQGGVSHVYEVEIAKTK